MERSMTNPWHISEAEFPRKGALSEQLHYLLNYAVIAPSGHNTHVAPWVIRAFDVGSRQAAEHRQLALEIATPGSAQYTSGYSGGVVRDWASPDAGALARVC